MSTAFPLYLALTAAEFSSCHTLPSALAWMACHFSCYGTGLSNVPEALPKGAMLILNDRTPVYGHDAGRIVAQLTQMAEQWQLDSILLDFQRPDNPETAAIAQAIVEALPCPVGVSDSYAAAFSCPVFLSPPPLYCPIDAYLAPWSGKELWLEAALGSQTIIVTENGSQYGPLLPEEGTEPCFEEPQLLCHYHIALTQTQADFTLFRTREDLDALLNAAESLGVTKAVGLYQELGNTYTDTA